jgi:hypothetical protein
MDSDSAASAPRAEAADGVGPDVDAIVGAVSGVLVEEGFMV